MQPAKFAPVVLVAIPICIWFVFHQLVPSAETPKAAPAQPVTTQAAPVENDDYEEYRRHIEIRDCAQKYIANMLKSPSTADHGLGTITKLSEGKYVLQSYVDAENAYGANLRANYSCNVELSGRECQSVVCEFD